MFAKCKCQNRGCGGDIEFDAADFIPSGSGGFGKTMGQKIQCPHCHQDTILYLKKNPVAAADIERKIAESNVTKKETHSLALILDLCGGIILFAGLVMIFDGCNAALKESELRDQSAIRGIENVCMYGIGFLLLAASMIIAALVRIIRK